MPAFLCIRLAVALNDVQCPVLLCHDGSLWNACTSSLNLCKAPSCSNVILWNWLIVSRGARPLNEDDDRVTAFNGIINVSRGKIDNICVIIIISSVPHLWFWLNLQLVLQINLVAGCWYRSLLTITKSPWLPSWTLAITLEKDYNFWQLLFLVLYRTKNFARSRDPWSTWLGSRPFQRIAKRSTPSTWLSLAFSANLLTEFELNSHLFLIDVMEIDMPLFSRSYIIFYMPNDWKVDAAFCISLSGQVARGIVVEDWESLSWEMRNGILHIDALRLKLLIKAWPDWLRMRFVEY